MHLFVRKFKDKQFLISRLVDMIIESVYLIYRSCLVAIGQQIERAQRICAVIKPINITSNYRIVISHVRVFIPYILSYGNEFQTVIGFALRYKSDPTNTIRRNYEYCSGVFTNGKRFPIPLNPIVAVLYQPLPLPTTTNSWLLFSAVLS